METLETQILIAGGGPAGCTFGRILADAGCDVLIVDAGGQHSRVPGEHLKNAAVYQRNLDAFTPIVQGMLQRISMPSQAAAAQCTMLDPISFRPDPGKNFKRRAHNPEQEVHRNLDAAAVAYGIGGMFTHWTNNTPRYDASELSPLIADDRWQRLYDYAEHLLDVNDDVFKHSLRHRVVGDALTDLYAGDESPCAVEPLPVAGHRRKDNHEFVCYTGCDTILKPLLDEDGVVCRPLEIREHHYLRKLVARDRHIEYALMDDLMDRKRFRVEAEQYVVAAGSLLTPQILWASDIEAPALGCYLTEHPLAFTQVVLRRELVERLAELGRAQGVAFDEDDAVPIPLGDPPPMLMIGVTEKRPWHCQIHRDSFAYGAVPDEIDDRLIVDLRWFGMTEPKRENRVRFSTSQVDALGLPKPIFEFELSEKDRDAAHTMMNDMIRAAGALGGFLPGSEPKFMPAGTSLHFMGTTRISDNVEDGVCNTHSAVWGYDNLRLGGNGMIPGATASNPSLTMVALAARAAFDMLDEEVPAPPDRAT